MAGHLRVRREKRREEAIRRKTWHKLAGVLGCVVVFCTTYALILPAITMEDQAFCGMEEHAHTSACYEGQALACGRAAHTHTLACYSNPEADVEDQAAWEASVAGVERTGAYGADVVAVAETQIGYRESANNYQVAADGASKQGYTRYGAWYGDPCAEWSALFVSFCLNYAGVPETAFPRSSDSAAWVEQLLERGLYHAAADYTPQAGDVVFLDGDGDGTADRAGLVRAADAPLRTIEGDAGGRVAKRQYRDGAAEVLGYGALPARDTGTAASNGASSGITTLPGVQDPNIKVTLIDYETRGMERREVPTDKEFWYEHQDADAPVNQGHQLQFGVGSAVDDKKIDFNVWVEKLGGLREKGVESKLGEDGYPVLNAGKNGIKYREPLGYLFGQPAEGCVVYPADSTLFQKDSDGYYYYDSDKNFAAYNKESQNFTLYSVPLASNNVQPNYPKFLPFNDLDIKENPVVDGTKTLYYIKDSNNTKPVDDYKALIRQYMNYHFGMVMETDFVLPPDGKLSNGEDMVFEFDGDDDVWVFIDDVLVLDMGGIHDDLGGRINFSTGKVTNSKSETFIENCFKDAGKTWDSSPYSTHTLKFFYLERGAVGSNCGLKFNLLTIPKNTLIVNKEVKPEKDWIGDPQILGNLEYEFQVLKLGEDGKPTGEPLIPQGTEYTLLGDDSKTYKVGKDGVFTLRSGQAAVFKEKLSADSGNYIVRERLKSGQTDQYQDILFTGNSGTATSIYKEGHIESDQFTGFDTEPLDSTAGTTRVIFTNRVDMKKLGSLRITKQYNGDPKPDTEFNMTVTLGGQPLPVGTQYKVVSGESVGREEKVKTAGVIPLKAGETAIIEDLLAGTVFQVKEQNPENQYTVTYEGTVKTTPEEEPQPLKDGNSGTLEVPGSTAHITVTNVLNEASVSLPLIKQLAHSDGQKDYTFHFEAVEVKSLTEHTPISGGGTQHEDITVGRDQTTGEETILFGFQNLTEDKDKEYYYKLSEVNGGESGVIYDTNYYIVAISVTRKEDQPWKAEITEVRRYSKDGARDDSFVWKNGDAAVFTNDLYGNLSLTKTISNSAGIPPDTAFKFEISLAYGGAPVSDSFRAEWTGGQTADGKAEDSKVQEVTFNNGKAELELIPGQTVTLKDLPAGTVAKVTETTTDGYAVSWSGNDIQSKEQNTVTLHPISTGATVAVTCNNAPGYELPQTGGSGMVPYTIAGALLLAAGAGSLLCRYKKRDGKGGRF